MNLKFGQRKTCPPIFNGKYYGLRNSFFKKKIKFLFLLQTFFCFEIDFKEWRIFFLENGLVFILVNKLFKF